MAGRAVVGAHLSPNNTAPRVLHRDVVVVVVFVAFVLVGELIHLGRKVLLDAHFLLLAIRHSRHDPSSLTVVRFYASTFNHQHRRRRRRYNANSQQKFIHRLIFILKNEKRKTRRDIFFFCFSTELFSYVCVCVCCRCCSR